MAAASARVAKGPTWMWSRLSAGWLCTEAEKPCLRRAPTSTWASVAFETAATWTMMPDGTGVGTDGVVAAGLAVVVGAAAVCS